MDEKRSQHELRRIIETAVAEVCGLPRPGVWFCVDQVQASGHPIASMTVWATLHFLPDGSPFCCCESGCHLGLFGEKLQAVEEYVRRSMDVQHPIALDFDDRINVQLHTGTKLRDLNEAAKYP